MDDDLEAQVKELVRQNAIMRGALQSVAAGTHSYDSLDDPPSYIRVMAALALQKLDPLSIAAGIIALDFAQRR